MIRDFKYGLFVFFLLVFQKGFSIIGNPIISRVCLDPATLTLTVYFRSDYADACNSFKKYILYGRESVANPYIKITELNVLNSNLINAVLPNNKAWEVFLVVKNACNGIDSFKSNLFTVDQTPPVLLEPDSVSIDLTTQQLVAGWQKSTDVDVLNYSLFKQDASANNILTTSTKNLYHLFPNADFDPKTTGSNRFTLAVNDSCNNGGLISSYHSPVFLSIPSLANANYKCDKKINIGWTSYVGWPVLNYEIWVKDNVLSVWKKEGTVSGATNTFTYNIPNFNKTYSFFVRAIKNDLLKRITSSSNVCDFVVANFPVFNKSFPLSVSVTNQNELTCKWTVSLSADTKEAILEYKNTGSSTWNSLLSKTSNGIFWNKLTGVNTATTIYAFRVSQKDICGNIGDISYEMNSIVINRNKLNLNWNPYINTTGTPSSFLLANNLTSSTWNTIPMLANNHVLTDTNNPTCFKVVVYSQNAGVYTDTAYSNLICSYIKDTTLIPNAYNPYSGVFKIVNPNIQKGEAKMLIYNRWGQQIWQGDALDGWNGMFENKPVMPGIYVYVVNVRRKIKNESFKGSVIVLK